MERPRVSVLMGGPSAEHEISLRSGQGVVASLIHRGWDVQAVVIPRPVAAEAARQFVQRALEETGCGVVFLALHGSFGEDGAIQDLCEALHLSYTGSDAKASRLGLDKVASRRRFEHVGLRVPAWQLVDPAHARELDACASRVRFPVVVKPTNQGSSLGVSMVWRREAFLEAVTHAAAYDTRVLVEEYIQGREVTVGILGELTLPVVGIQPSHAFFDYTAKYTPGVTSYTVPATLEPALAKEVQAAGRGAHEAIGCRHFSRVDMMLNEANQPVILEVNTIPGLTATSLLPKAAACAGIPYDELCERIAWFALASRAASVSFGRPSTPTESVLPVIG